jgi:hypothetical protein
VIDTGRHGCRSGRSAERAVSDYHKQKSPAHLERRGRAIIKSIVCMALTSRPPGAASPRGPLHRADAVVDHEAAAGLLRDRDLERGAGQFERAADGERFAYTRLSGLGG